MKKKLLRTLLFTGFICTSFPIENDFNKCLDEVIKKSDSAEKEMIEIIEKRAQEANSNEIFSELQLWKSNIKAVRNKMKEKLDKELKNTTKDPLLAQLQGYNFMYKNMLHQLELEDQIRSSIQLELEDQIRSSIQK